MSKIIDLLHNPYRLFPVLATKGFLINMQDEKYLKHMFYALTGRKLNLNTPRTFNEKIQWLKLYDRCPKYTMMVDKYAVRKYIADTIGKEYLVPLLGVWDDPNEIDFDVLPNQFVLKCNHNSGRGMCICRNKSNLNIEAIKKELRRGLKQNYYLTGREWPYKDVSRRIIAEKYLEDKDGELKDYKFLCFNGKCKCSFICSDRFTGKGLHVTFFDEKWNVMPFERHYPSRKDGLLKPYNYNKMIEFAEKLSVGIPFIRVDFYEVDGHLYFGELTLYPGGGFEEFTPQEWDYILGSWIELPKN